MKREDFIRITEEHINTAEKLLTLKYCTDGICLSGNCPFDEINNPEKRLCFDKYTECVATEVEDKKLVESCKEFLSMFKKEDISDDTNLSLFSERNIDFLLEKYDFHQNNLMCMEELAELQQAISKVLRNKEGSRENLIEEMSDVLIVINMLQRLHNISDSTLEEEIETKMKRNLDRAKDLKSK